MDAAWSTLVESACFGYLWLPVGGVPFLCFLAVDGMNGWNFEFYEKAGYIGYSLVASATFGLLEQFVLKVHEDKVKTGWWFRHVNDNARKAFLRVLEGAGNSCQLLFHCKKHGFEFTIGLFSAGMALRTFMMLYLASRIAKISWKEACRNCKADGMAVEKFGLKELWTNIKPVNCYTDLSGGGIKVTLTFLVQAGLMYMYLIGLAEQDADIIIPTRLEDFNEMEEVHKFIEYLSFLRIKDKFDVFVLGSAVATFMRMVEPTFFWEDGGEYLSFWVLFFKAQPLDFTWQSSKACVRFVWSLLVNEWAFHLVWSLVPALLLTIDDEVDFFLNAVAVAFIYQLDDWFNTLETKPGQRLVSDVFTTELLKAKNQKKKKKLQSDVEDFTALVPLVRDSQDALLAQETCSREDVEIIEQRLRDEMASEMQEMQDRHTSEAVVHADAVHKLETKLAALEWKFQQHKQAERPTQRAERSTGPLMAACLGGCSRSRSNSLLPSGSRESPPGPP